MKVATKLLELKNEPVERKLSPLNVSINALTSTVRLLFIAKLFKEFFKVSSLVHEGPT